MTTRVYLGGGGSPDDEAALWRMFLSRGRRVVCWPQALPSSRYDIATRWLRRALVPHGIDSVDTWPHLADHDLDDLDPDDIVMVLGGNTFDLLHHVQVTGAAHLAREHVARGGIYYGGSAGAVLAGADIEVAAFADPNDAAVSDTTGLGLLGDAIVRPHYEVSDRAEAGEWATRGFTVLGIPERGGVAVVDGAAVSSGPDDVDVVTATAVRVLRAGESTALGVR
jgi:dipeptidase E